MEGENTATICIYAATRNGVGRAVSANPGEWNVSRTLTDEQVHCVAAHPLNPGILFAGTQGHGVFRSRDGGETWQRCGLAGHIVRAVAVSPDAPDTVYAGIRPARMFISRDGGDTWSELEGFRNIPSRWWWFSPASPPFTAYVQEITPVPGAPGVLLAGMEFGAVVRSTDGGLTWPPHLRGALRDCHSLVAHPNSGWVYEGGGGGFRLSRDGGETWSALPEGLAHRYGWAVAADPGRPSVIYHSAAHTPGQAHSNGGARAYLYRSVDGGPWQRLEGGLPTPLRHMAYALVTNPKAPGHVYAGLGSGEVWHSADYGDSWRRLPIQFAGLTKMVLMERGRSA